MSVFDALTLMFQAMMFLIALVGLTIKLYGRDDRNKKG